MSRAARTVLGLLLVVPACTESSGSSTLQAMFEPNGDSALLPGASHAGWWQAATDAIGRAEYEYATGFRGEVSAPNRAQGLRTTLSSRGIRVVPRNTDVLAGGAPGYTNGETAEGAVFVFLTPQPPP